MILFSKKSMSKIIRKKKRNENAHLQGKKKKKKLQGALCLLIMVNKCFYKGKVLGFKVLLNI